METCNGPIGGGAKGAELTRRGLLAGLMSGAMSAAAIPVLAEAPLTSLFPVPRGGKPRVVPPSPADLIAEAKLTGIVAFVVADAQSGRVLEAELGDALVPPASVTKMVTALYALARLGPGYQFVTQVVATGPVQAGVIQGDLILVGGGDPTLDTDRLGDLVARLAQSGIRGITGRFGVFAGNLPQIGLIDAGQPDYVGYNPSVSGLNLNFNRVHFSWKRRNGDYELAMDARGTRFVPPVRMTTMQVAERDLPLFAFAQDEARDRWSVARPALGREGSRWLPVRKPAIYAGEVFAWLAQAQGVSLPEAVVLQDLPQGTKVLAQDRSAVLTDILEDMLLYSTNLTAEVVGLRASGLGTLAQSAADMGLWAQGALGMTSRFNDHSGLGAGSRTTAADMVRAIVAAKALPTGRLLPGLLRDVGMRDATGDIIRDDPAQVRAKSGTLNFVSGLAGIITPANRRELAFAIFAADVPRREGLRPHEMEDPEGGAGWTRRARVMQGRLISRWAALYG